MRGDNVALADPPRRQSGGEPPAPEPETVPNIASYKGLSGNDLLAALAADAATLRDKLKAWKAAAQKIGDRLPNWRLAERLVALASQLFARPRDIV